MSLVEQSLFRRNRSHEPLPGSGNREADRKFYLQSTQSRITLVWSSDPVVPSGTSAAMTRFTAAATARLGGYAGGDALHIVLAIFSWILREFLHGCAAYARAMYPPIENLDHEWDTDEAAKPVAPELPGREAATAAKKPRLTIAASNEQSPAKPRSGAR